MTINTLNNYYFNVDEARHRYQRLLDFFASEFEGHKPSFITRSPGRMNIIGDHIDYSYFPCLPAAISYDVVMAVEVVDDPHDAGYGKIQLVNTDTKFRPETFAADPNVRIESHSWANYFKCSWITSLKDLGITSTEDTKGMRIAITGNVPADSGLSSSAAFVVSGCLAVIRAHRPTYVIDKSSLVRLTATCEQLVGVNSGGLDQAASIFGKKDHALLVNFRPELEVEPLRFHPRNDPLVFLIANSLVVSAKLETAPVRYNLRVVEVTIAANVLAKKMGIQLPDDGNLRKGTLYSVLIGKFGHISRNGLIGMIEMLDKNLHREPYSQQEVADILDISIDKLLGDFLTAFPVKFEGLRLYQRAKHVYEETLRVLKFVKGVKTDANPKMLGDLMNESQLSSETLYENSHPDCERLCSIARKAGSLGSRITGAGWGGCTVHLVSRSQVQTVKSALYEEYYSKYHPNAPTSALVETRPSGGSAILNDI